MNNSEFNGTRPVAYYKRATPRRLLGTPPSVPLVVCGHCETHANHLDYQGREKRVRVCRTCGYALRKRPAVTRRSRSDEELLHEAQKQTEKILSDIARKMTSLKKHQRRIRYYTAKLEGRLKKYTPKTTQPIRTITVA